jgi:hypothetical protein
MFSPASGLSGTVARYDARDVLALLVRRAEINMVSQAHLGCWATPAEQRS